MIARFSLTASVAGLLSIPSTALFLLSLTWTRGFSAANLFFWALAGSAPLSLVFGTISVVLGQKAQVFAKQDDIASRTSSVAQFIAGLYMIPTILVLFVFLLV